MRSVIFSIKNYASFCKYTHGFLFFLNSKNNHDMQLTIIFYFRHRLIKSLFFQFHANRTASQRKCRFYC